uniref:Uncharacterized protein n=1 Tax=Arundo donax TaxID=35708 RepID=A0A0A9HQY5_ARUDO
MPTEMHPLLPR